MIALRPGELGLLLGLLREGARSVSGTRRLTPAEVDLLQVIELYAYDVRSASGTVGRQGDPARAPSWLTVDQAAKELRVSREFVRRLARSGALVAERRGRAWMVSADSISCHKEAAA